MCVQLVGMNFSSDLCTLDALTESALLCSIEQRCRGELTEVSSIFHHGNDCKYNFVNAELCRQCTFEHGAFK